jgi:hypothetical protein
MDVDLFQSLNDLNLQAVLCDTIKNSPSQINIKTVATLWKVEFFSILAHVSLLIAKYLKHCIWVLCHIIILRSTFNVFNSYWPSAIQTLHENVKKLQKVE